MLLQWIQQTKKHVLLPIFRLLRSINKYPPAKPEVLRLLAPQRGLTAIAKSKPKTEKTTNGRLPELSNFEILPAEPGVYHDSIIQVLLYHCLPTPRDAIQHLLHRADIK